MNAKKNQQRYAGSSVALLRTESFSLGAEFIPRH
jgi:hypothetical protein